MSYGNRNRDIDREIARAAGQIRRTELPPAEAERAAADVWQRLEQRLAAEADAPAAEIETIRGCDDYQALIPAFLSGNLAPSRALLFEDHTRHCVPCRKALKSARAGESVGASTARVQRQGWSAPRWAAAALIAVAGGATGYYLWNTTPAQPYGAIVESSGGGLYRVATLEPVAIGDEVAIGERLRTAVGETPILRLPDGSSVEVRDRSELSIDATRRATTVRIERGEVIVEATGTGPGRLYVSTDDCLVSVKGTIFAVSHGTKGSRVSVIEGEVRVDTGGEERALFAGDRTTTYAAYGTAAASFDQELAWSQNVGRYLALLGEVQALREALERDLPWPGLRYSSRLLDLAPDDVSFYAAFPNLAETLIEANRIVDQQISTSPLLSEWWSSTGAGGSEVRTMLERATEVFGEAGGYLGDEVVVAVVADATGDMDAPVFLAELVDPAGLRSFLERQIAEHGDAADGTEDIAIYESDLPAALPGDDLIVWLGADTMVAGTEAARVRAAVSRVEGGAGGLPAAGFKRQLAEAYADGADILVAVDLQKMGPAAELAETPDGERETLERTGILGAQHVILQHRRIDGRAHNDAVMTFDGPRRGVAGWLAAPAPMGSLRYISPDAKLAAAAVMKSPVEIFDEIFAIATATGHDCGPESPSSPHGCDPVAELDRLQSEMGLSLRDDIAAALGGEVAMALDGPVVPEPAWKVVMEVYDPAKLVWALHQMVAHANVELARQGLPPVELVEESADGRIYYGVAGTLQPGATQAVTIQPMRFAFDEGYLIAAPNRALVDRAIRFRQSGYTLETSSRFTGLLPEDGRTNFSALVYQDALGLLEPLAGRIAESDLTAEQRAALDALRSETDPILAYAYGEEDRIVFAASGIGDLFASGLPGLLSMGLIERQPGEARDGATDGAEATAGETV